MKKLFLLVATLFSMATSTFAASLEQGEDTGFGLKFHAGFCSGNFGDTEKDGKTTPAVGEGCSMKNTPLFGLSIDNRWYVANPGRFGIGIDARWLDGAVGKSTLSYKDVDYAKTTNIELGMIMPGVVGTFYLGNNMALDLFYNIGPNVFVQMDEGLVDAASDAKDITDKNKTGNLTKEDLINKNNTYNAVNDALDNTYFDFGISHFVGAAFRYKFLQAGVEYNIAKLKRMDWGDSTADDNGNINIDINESTMKVNRNNLRVFVGFKF